MLQLCLLAPLLAGNPALGHWRATLGPADSEVPFDLALALENGKLSAAIRNGEEEIAVPEVVWHGSDVVLSFPHYDSRITAKLADDGKSMSGEWKKRSGKEKWTTLEFRAQAGELPRFAPAQLPNVYLTGFEIKIAVGGSETPGSLSIAPGSRSGVHASIRTPTGDLRYLAGSYDGSHLQLSEFDG